MECRESKVVYVVSVFCEIFDNLEQAFEFCKQEFNERDYCTKMKIEWAFNHDTYEVVCVNENGDEYNYTIKKKLL